MRKEKTRVSKPIKITEEYQKKLLDEFAEAIRNVRLTDGKISYSKSVKLENRRATLCFTEKAWLKMKLLVYKWDKEIAWHGIAKRNGKDKYIISDILVYPQEVTGATVTTNQREYEAWLMNFEDDIFNNIRMQGHSHVDMGVTPSGVDRTLYGKILDQLDDDMFYIFLIWNKSDEKTIEIYDFLENVMFETADIDIKIIEENIGAENFLKNAFDKVKHHQVLGTKPNKAYRNFDKLGYSSGYEAYVPRAKKKVKKMEEI